MVRSNLRLVVFPVADEAFREDVEAAVKRIPDELTDELARTHAEADLKHWYRSLQIRERDDLGGYPDDPIRVWYVYRDGRVRRQNPIRDRLYDALATARSTRTTSEDAIASARRTVTDLGFDVAGHSLPVDGGPEDRSRS
jgi:hypothetical protein